MKEYCKHPFNSIQVQNTGEIYCCCCYWTDFYSFGNIFEQSFDEIWNGKRAKEYESTINYLVNNQIVFRSYKVTSIKSPISSCKEPDSFKLYACDDGLLYTMLHLIVPPTILMLPPS